MPAEPLPRSANAPITWIDAHLDLAYLDVNGRDMRVPVDAAAPH